MWPNWLVMWLLALGLYAALKLLTWGTTRTVNVPAGRHAGYLLFWPGMDAARFFDTRRCALPPTGREWLWATMKLLFGGLLLAGLSRPHPPLPVLVEGWLALIGIASVLHFGLFHLLSCYWRHRGIDAEPLMHWPIAARSVSEFWGKRWNLAFRDLTHRFVFRPLTPRIGAMPALLCGFLISGLLHDLVISWPAGGGYGGPTAYFLLQGFGLLVERSALGRRLQLGHGVRGWLFTAAVVLLPAGMLFHTAFLERALLPFVRSLGEVS